MKCINCPCSHTTWYPEADADWECVAGMEDDMDEDEEGCDITEEKAQKIADLNEKAYMDYIEAFCDWLEKKEAE